MKSPASRVSPGLCCSYLIGKSQCQQVQHDVDKGNTLYGPLAHIPWQACFWKRPCYHCQVGHGRWSEGSTPS